MAILLSKEVGEMEQAEILNGSLTMKCVDIEDAIISRDTLRTARRETEVSLNVGHPTRREENLLRIQRKWNSVSSHGWCLRRGC